MAGTAKFTPVIAAVGLRGELYTLSSKALDADVDDPTFTDATKHSRFRRWDELHPKQKRTCRERWQGGASMMAIASHIGVFPGDLQNVADKRGWKRNAPIETLSSRAVKLAVEEPLLSNAEVARRVGCSPATVGQAKKRSNGGAK